MKERLKYFVFNKVQDYLDGCLEGMACDSEGLWAVSGKTGGRSAFLSPLLDSREKDMEWHRMTFSFDSQGVVPYELTVFTSNTRFLNDAKEPGDLNQLIKAPDYSFEEKLERMAPYIRKQETRTRDFLLYGVTGRYLWIGVEIFSRGSLGGKLGHLKVYFPKQSFVTYLPEIYQTGDSGRFLERYLAVFQTIHEDMNQRIREVPDLLDVDSTKGEYLTWLAGWLHIAGSYMWSENQLRLLMKNALSLYKKRGTREGILEFIRLYTGGEAYLVEFYQIEPYLAVAGLKESLSKLYGVSPYTFQVILKKEWVPTQKDYKSLVRVLEEIKPAQMEADLVVLEPYLFLGSHVYLGINSALSEYRSFSLDGLSMIPFSAISSAGAGEMAAL